MTAPGEPGEVTKRSRGPPGEAEPQFAPTPARGRHLALDRRLYVCHLPKESHCESPSGLMAGVPAQTGLLALTFGTLLSSQGADAHRSGSLDPSWGNLHTVLGGAVRVKQPRFGLRRAHAPQDPARDRALRAVPRDRGGPRTGRLVGVRSSVGRGRTLGTRGAPVKSRHARAGGGTSGSARVCQEDHSPRAAAGSGFRGYSAVTRP